MSEKNAKANAIRFIWFQTIENDTMDASLLLSRVTFILVSINC